MKISKLLAAAVSFSLAVSSAGTFGMAVAAEEEDDGAVLDVSLMTDSVSVYPNSTNTIQPLTIDAANKIVMFSFDITFPEFCSDYSVAGLYGETTVEKKENGYHVTIRDDAGISTGSPISITFKVGTVDEGASNNAIHFDNYDYTYVDTNRFGGSFTGGYLYIDVTDCMSYEENGICFLVYQDHVAAEPSGDEVSSVTLPATYRDLPVTEAEFWYSSTLKYIDCDENNTSLSSYDGVLFDRAQEELLCFPNAMQKSAYEVPDTVTKIAENAFWYPKNLTKLTIPESVTEIEEGAIFPENDNFTIYGKAGSAAETYAKDHYITFCDIESGQTIAPNIFGTCGDDLTWNLDENGLMTISGTGDMAEFDQQKNGAYTPWLNYTSYIKEVVVEEGVTSVSNDAFAWCNKLKKVSLPDSLLELGYQAFYCCTNLTDIVLPKNLQVIGEDAFVNDGLSELTIPESVTTIGTGAFGGCRSLKEVYIPASVSEIGWNVFWNCCEFIEVAEDNQNYSSENGILYNKDKTEIVSIPYNMKDVKLAEGITEITSGTFERNNQLTSVYIPSTVSTIDTWMFSECTSLSEITVSPENPDFQSIDGVLYCTDHTLLRYPPAKKDLDYRVIDGTQKIADQAFRDSVYLTSLSLPASITELHNYNFLDSKKICSIEVDEDNPNYSSYAGVVYSKTETGENVIPPNLTTLKLPETAVSCNLHEYQNCSNALQMLILPASVKSFDTGMLEYYFQDLKDVYYPGSADELEISGDLPRRVKIHYNMEGPVYAKGDINGDGSVFVSDNVILQKYLIGCYRFNQEQWLAADMNADGQVDGFDLALVRKELIG